MRISNKRQFADHLIFIVAMSVAFVSVGVLIAIITVIFSKGLPALSFEFFTAGMAEAGAAGGIIYNILGTLILMVTTFAFSTPLAVGLALTHSVYLRNYPTFKHRIYLLLNLLNGVPSIIFGLMGMIIFVGYLDMGKSWLIGGLLLAMMILPNVCIALIERIEAIPEKYIEAGYSMGLSQGQIVWTVIIPFSINGLVTGTLLGLSRAIGETAPIIFTATIFAGATIPDGIRDNPVLSLPYHIFILAQESFNPVAGDNLWGAAFVLLGIVSTMSLLALPLRLKIHEESHV